MPAPRRGGGSRSEDSRYSGISIKARIKAHDPADVVLFHDGQMNRVASGETRVTQDNFLGTAITGMRLHLKED